MTAALYMLGVPPLVVSIWMFFRMRQGPVLLPFVYALAWLYVSSAYLETGVYITEQGRASSYVGSTLLLWSLLVTAIVTFAVFARYVTPPPMPGNFRYRNRGLAVAIALSSAWLGLGALLANLVLSEEIPLLSSSATRFNFWTDFARFPWLGGLLGELSLPIACLFGTAHAFGRITRRRGLANHALVGGLVYIMYLLLLGHKLGGPVLAVFCFVVPALLPMNSRQRYAAAKAGLVWLMALVAFSVWFAVRDYVGRGLTEFLGGSPLTAVLYRVFALQGHVWWGVVEDRGYSLVNLDLDLLQEGMHGLMRLVSGEIAELYIAAGVSFTGSFPANLIGAFGVLPALLIVMFLSAFTAAVGGLLHGLVGRGSVLRAAVAMQALIWLFAGVGDLMQLASPRFLVTLALLWAMSRWNVTLWSRGASVSG
jgi:hypothetical protein